MPTNLPPDYFRAEKRFREAETTADKIASLEELIATVPKHKGTDHLRADLRRRLAKLKDEAQAHRKAGKREPSVHIDREGAGQVVLVGPTNAGKSALVARLTNATPEVSEVPYTTWKPVPGMMPIDNVRVQLVDTPPLDREFLEPEVFALIRRADLILLVVDLQADPLGQLAASAAVLEEHRIAPPHRAGRYAEEARMTCVPLWVLANKCDDEGSAEVFHIFQELLEEAWSLLPVSAETGYNLERLKQVVFEELGIVRVYAKPPGREPDRSAPFVVKRGSTIAGFAEQIHRDFYEKFKSARVWGSSEFDGQMVGRDFVLHDGDVVELRI